MNTVKNGTIAANKSAGIISNQSARKTSLHVNQTVGKLFIEVIGISRQR